MSSTIARQGDRVQLEHSDMRLAFNMGKMAKGGFSCAAIEETQHQIKKPHAEVREEKKRGVEFPEPKKGKAAMERHPAMVYKNHTAGWPPCQNGTAKNLQICWRRKGTAALPTESAAPVPGTPSSPGTPAVAQGDTEGNESYEMEGMPSKRVYMHSLHPNTQFFNHTVFAKDSKRDTEFIPDLLNYTTCCVEILLTLILKTTTVFWTNLGVRTRIDWKEREFWVLSLSTISRHFKVYFKGYIYMHNWRTM